MSDLVAAAKAALDKVIEDAQAIADELCIGVRVELGQGKVAAAPDSLVPEGEISYVWMDESVSKAIDGGG